MSVPPTALHRRKALVLHIAPMRSLRAYSTCCRINDAATEVWTRDTRRPAAVKITLSQQELGHTGESTVFGLHNRQRITPGTPVDLVTEPLRASLALTCGNY